MGVGLFFSDAETNTVSPYLVSLLWGCYVNGTRYGDTVLVSASEKNNPTPISFKLYQNYPNPFNSVTVIPYEVSNTSFVLIKVSDILGRGVASLVNETRDEGSYTVNFDASSLPSGVYIYTLRVNNFVSRKKMTVLK